MFTDKFLATLFMPKTMIDTGLYTEFNFRQLLVHKLIIQFSKGLRVGIMCFATFLAAGMIVAAVGDLTSPIDGAEDVVEKIHQIKIDAIWFGGAVFFIIFTYPRPAFLKRVPIAILAACLCWLIVWKFFYYCEYVQLHTQGIDLGKVLQNAEPH